MSDMIKWAGETIPGNIIIERAPETNRPVRKYVRYAVPGRDGDIIAVQDAWENVSRKYTIGISGDYSTATEDLMEWLYLPKGYQRLEDSFDPDVYRRAYVGDATVISNTRQIFGECELVFECDPRRFLKSGETAIELTETDDVINPTSFASKPVITVYGAGEGSITIGGNTLTILEITDGMVIDCENLIAYKDSANLNSIISGTFPVIPAGTREVTIEGGITSVEVVPNWWSL